MLGFPGYGSFILLTATHSEKRVAVPLCSSLLEVTTADTGLARYSDDAGMGPPNWNPFPISIAVAVSLRLAFLSISYHFLED